MKNKNAGGLMQKAVLTERWHLALWSEGLLPAPSIRVVEMKEKIQDWEASSSGRDFSQHLEKVFHSKDAEEKKAAREWINNRLGKLGAKLLTPDELAKEIKEKRR